MLEELQLNVQTKDPITCCWLEKELGTGSSKITGVSGGENGVTSELSSETPVPFVCMAIMPFSTNKLDLFFFNWINLVF